MTPADSQAAWDCHIGTPEEDHDWEFVGGDPDVGISDCMRCRACGLERDTTPDDYDDEF